VEIEAKYTAPDAASFESLLQLKTLGAYTLRPKGERELLDHYFDTADRALLKGGYACRLREGEADSARVAAWVATIKGLGGADGALHQREEHEAEVPPHSAFPDWPESPVREMVSRLSGGEPLVELFSLCQHRARRAVKQGRRLVGELSLDRVEMGAGDGKATTHEVEIELSPTGTMDDLKALDEALQVFKLRAQPKSKFERALELLDAPPPAPKKKKHPGVRADEPMAEAGRKVLRFHFERMLVNEAGTREGSDIEALHDMRVAVRRQRAAFRFVEPYFKRKAIRSFQAELKTLAGHLGAVRDLDVLIETATSYQSSLSQETSEAFQSLLDEWNRQRNFARDALLNYLNSDEYGAFTEKYGAFLSEAGAGVKEADSPESPKPTLVRHILPAEIWTHYGDLRVYETVLDWASLETLHALRIEGKRLRYLLEFFAEVLDPTVEEAVEAMVALQDHLGELHDTDVTIGLLREYLMQGAQSQLKPESAEAVNQYLRVKENRLRTLQRTLKRPWRRVNGGRFRKILGRAVAGL
jgi:CHAD domain-containing protein